MMSRCLFHKAEQIKEERGGQILFPAHILLMVNTQELADAPLHRTQDAGDDGLLSVHDFAHIESQRDGKDHQDAYIQHIL